MTSMSCTMQLSLLVGDGAGDIFIKCLPFPDLARFEMTSKAVCDAMLLTRYWEDVAWETLSGFAVGSQVMTCSPSIDLFKLQQLRREVKLLVSQLHGIRVSGSSLVPVPNIASARALASAMQRAKSAGSMHMASGGVAARIFIGQVSFPMPTSPLQPNSDTFIPSKPIAFSFVGEAGCKAADETFKLKFAWGRDALFLRIWGPDVRNVERPPNALEDIATDGEETPDESDQDSDNEEAYPRSLKPSTLRTRHLEVDVCAAGQAPLVRTRGTVLQIGGGWRKARGVVSACMAPAALSAISLVTFVVSVRDAKSVVSASPSYTHALNIDAPSRR